MFRLSESPDFCEMSLEQSQTLFVLSFPFICYEAKSVILTTYPMKFLCVYAALFRYHRWLVPPTGFCLL